LHTSLPQLRPYRNRVGTEIFKAAKRCTDADTGSNDLPWLLVDDAGIAKARRAPTALRLRPGTANLCGGVQDILLPSRAETFLLCKDDIPAGLR